MKAPGIFIFATGFALLSLGVGATTAITTPTTTTTTTSTTSTTTTTLPGGNPCTAYWVSVGAATSIQTSNFPCPNGNTSWQPSGITLTVAKHDGSAGACTATSSSTAKSNCPANVDYNGGYEVKACTTIDGWDFNDHIEVDATNGTHAVNPAPVPGFTTEQLVANAACVKITRSRVIVPNGQCTGTTSNCFGIAMGFTTSGGQCRISGVPNPCGPLYLADSEIQAPIPTTGQSYGTDDTNEHIWRSYIHGGTQAVDSDGFSEVHDSFLLADHVNTGGGVHMDAFLQQNGDNGETAGRWVVLDHNTMQCAGASTNCTGDMCICLHGCPTVVTPPSVSQSAAPSGCPAAQVPVSGVNFCASTPGCGETAGIAVGVVVTNNYFAPSDGSYCSYTGEANENVEVEGYSPVSVRNQVWENNVYARGGNNKCATLGPYPDWDAGSASRQNNTWCNNLWTDGSVVAQANELNNPAHNC